MEPDIILEGGLVFDGRGSQPVRASVALRGDRVLAVSEAPIARGPHTRVIDCAGAWVMPGFIDLHTHYDAEIELAPALTESLRHGVTSVVLGSCSLSVAVGTPDDLADLFCRVEAIPDEIVRPLLRRCKTWDDHAAYLDHLETLALGPNVASFVGHSAVRAKVMGLERSLEQDVRPDARELDAMATMLDDALDAGYLGLSVQTLAWDKMGGDKAYRSRPLPSTFARWSEYRRLSRTLRKRGRVLQGVPSPTRPFSSLLFFVESVGLVRRPLKTTMISMLDLRATRWSAGIMQVLARTFNTVFEADVRWQALPEPFDLWADGIDLVVFEEFGAGAAALHLREHADRAELFRDPEYRARFRRDWADKLSPRFFHRDLGQSLVLACPGDPSLVGRSFAQIARDLGADAADTFLALVGEHGTSLRWYTVMGNDRPDVLERTMAHPDVLIGFSDAGAHLRQMAHYNFPLRMLRRVQEAAKLGAPFMTVERAVQRLTSEIAEWLGLDAGTLVPGARADVVVVDPTALDESVETAAEAPMDFFGGYVRMVRRNDRAVKHVFVAGREAFAHGVADPAVGVERFGRVLRAKDTRPAPGQLGA